MATLQHKPAMAFSRSVPICGWAELAGLPSWELVILKEGRRRRVQIRLAIEEHLFSGASSPNCTRSKII
jgi:hypothetical protein